MKNILMLTPYLPYPPVSGGRSRTYNIIKRLYKEYRFTLVCFGRPEEQAFDLSPLRELCELIVIDREPSPGRIKAGLLSLTSLKPITMRLYTSTKFKETINWLLANREYDLFHIESFYMLQNLPEDIPIPTLLAEPSIEYVAWMRYASVAKPIYQRPVVALEALKMRLFEPKAWARSNIVGVMSKVDEAMVKKIAPNVTTTLTPNGVDVDFFQPGTEPRDPDQAVYMGDYKYFPNADAILYFAQTMMPLIRQKRPNFILNVLGKEPTPEIVALGNDPSSGIRVLGLVDDTRPYLTKAGVFICPQRSGGGTRFKLLEAMACGCPIVSTSLGAEGLIAPDQKHMLIADTPQAFVEAMLKVLSDFELSSQLSYASRQWVVDHHSWNFGVKLLSLVYKRMIGSDDATLRKGLPGD